MTGEKQSERKGKQVDNVNFDELELKPELLRGIEHMGFTAMTPIQEASMETILNGEDIIGQAQTGTGKTAAFGVPILQKIDPKDPSLQAVILCPTRELAVQVGDELHRLCRYMRGIRITPIFGGQ